MCGGDGGALAGLGLNISHVLTQKLGGRIALVDGPLPGACFRFHLPLPDP